MIEVVWNAARAATRLDRVIIATDDGRIAEAAGQFGAEAMMTATDHPSGTDRVAEVVRAVDDPYDIVVNVQGDEPMVTPTSIDRLLAVFDVEPAPDMATLAEPIDLVDELFDPNAVKVVTDSRGRALYFSRSPIPYYRGEQRELNSDFRRSLTGRGDAMSGYRKHPGIYAYRRDKLLELARLGPSRLEVDEGLEQLRALEAGLTIQVVDSDFRSQPVDTPADLDLVARLLTEAH